MSSLQFIFAVFGSAIFISAASLIWPKVTNKPSPAPLTAVRQVVEQTPLGKQAADVLGVSDVNPQQINLQDWAVSQGNAIVSNVEQSASQAVVSGVVKQMIGEIDKLPDNQKLQLQQILCSPQSATSSAGK